MNYLYLNKIERFVNENTNDILNQLKDNFRKAYNDNPNIGQVKAWESSINYLRGAFLNQVNIYELTIVFEYNLPFSNERIDLLIFGKNNTNRPTLLVFELKGWKKATNTLSDFIVDCDLGNSVHPEYQVENYAVSELGMQNSSENDIIIYSDSLTAMVRGGWESEPGDGGKMALTSPGHDSLSNNSAVGDENKN